MHERPIRRRLRRHTVREPVVGRRRRAARRVVGSPDPSNRRAARPERSRVAASRASPAARTASAGSPWHSLMFGGGQAKARSHLLLIAERRVRPCLARCQGRGHLLRPCLTGRQGGGSRGLVHGVPLGQRPGRRRRDICGAGGAASAARPPGPAPPSRPTSCSPEPPPGPPAHRLPGRPARSKHLHRVSDRHTRCTLDSTTRVKSTRPKNHPVRAHPWKTDGAH
jgi:hypothetical protein